MTDGMDAPPTGPAAGCFGRESPLDPDGTKVPSWKFIHAKDEANSSCTKGQLRGCSQKAGVLDHAFHNLHHEATSGFCEKWAHPDRAGNERV